MFLSYGISLFFPAALSVPGGETGIGRLGFATAAVLVILNGFLWLFYARKKAVETAVVSEKQEEERTLMIEKLNNFVKNERIINFCLQRITVENDYEKAVREMLSIIGLNTEADRCHIFEYNKNSMIAKNIFEWQGNGTPSMPEKVWEVNTGNFRELIRDLKNHKHIVLQDLSNPAPGYENLARFLRTFDTKSLLTAGIWQNDELWGFIALDYVQKKHSFSDSDIHTIHDAANLLLLARERNRQMKAVADNVHLQQQIFDNTANPILLFDAHGKVATANPEFYRVSDTDPREIQGKTCRGGLCGAAGIPPNCPCAITAADRLPHQADFTTEDGKSFIISSQPIFDRNGNLTFILENAVDVTVINESRKKLESAVRAARAADNAKSYFLATISHELRTPLNAVIGFSELLKNGDTPKQQQLEYLQEINLAGNSLLHLINDVLDLTRIEAGHMAFKSEPTNCAALLEEIRQFYHAEASEKHLIYRVICPDGMPSIEIDQQRLRQILLNLVGNAIKFTAEGTILTHAYFEEAATGNTGTLRIAVADTGIGIDKDDLGKIFEPFGLAEHIQGTKTYQGTGLGLSVAKQLAEKMNGAITVVSSPGKGSTFTMEFQGVKTMRDGNRSVPSATSKEVLSNKKILIVDDVPMNLKVMDSMLRKIGVLPEKAASGDEALLLIKQENFDILLTDMWMPGMNGAQLAQEVRKIPERSDLKIYAVTADIEADSNFDMKLFNGILHKPIVMDRVRRMIEA